MSEPREALATLRDLADRGELDHFCEERGIRLLVAFGSVADRQRAEPGDLDLAVLIEDGVPLVAVVNAFTSLLGTDAVDVVDVRRADPVLRHRALVGAVVPLYECERGLFAEEQIAAMLTYMDTAWLRRLDLETMAGP